MRSCWHIFECILPIVLLLLTTLPSCYSSLIAHSCYKNKKERLFICRRPSSFRDEIEQSIDESTDKGRKKLLPKDGGTRYRITPDVVESVKSMADIVSIIESYGLEKFARTGNNRAVALCPFHDDHNPSLSIDGDRRMYRCFSCGAAGDVFQFVREYARVVDGNLGDKEIISFPNAVSFVATEFLSSETVASLNLKPYSENKVKKIPSHEEKIRQEEDEKKKERLYLAHSAAAEYFCSSLMTLKSAGQARSHLRSRGVNPSLVREFMLGYAPDTYFGIESQGGSNHGKGSVSKVLNTHFRCNHESVLSIFLLFFKWFPLILAGRKIERIGIYT